MPARVDLHFHLLPGVDDGPATMEHSLALARAAVRDGTATVVATPHVRGDFHTEVDDLPARVREVRAALAAEAIPLRILCGAELGHDMVARLTESELQTVAIGPPGARWLLLESPFAIDPAFHDAADELRERGFGVVLAHPERSVAVLADDGAGLRREVERGAVLQVNASSLTGEHGPTARAAAKLLVHAGMAGALASDAHSLARGPALERGLGAVVRAGVPEPVARLATDLGPVRLVTGGLVRSRTAAYAS